MNTGIIGPDPVHSQISNKTRHALAEAILDQISDAFIEANPTAVLDILPGTGLDILEMILHWCDPVFLAALDTAYHIKDIEG